MSFTYQVFFIKPPWAYDAIAKLKADDQISKLERSELEDVLKALGEEVAAEFTALILEQEFAEISDPTAAFRAKTLGGKLYPAFLNVFCSQKISTSEVMKDILAEVQKKDSPIHKIEIAKTSNETISVEDKEKIKKITSELYEKICAFVESTTSDPVLKKVHTRLYQAARSAFQKTPEFASEADKNAQAFLIGNFFIRGISPNITTQVADVSKSNKQAGRGLLYLSKAFQNIAQNITKTEKEPHMAFSNELANEFDLSRVKTMLHVE